ncbi:MAG: SH3 domain-containing protein [bacterium]|nr:SH3 domain-containing protein [bacterium]
MRNGYRLCLILLLCVILQVRGLWAGVSQERFSRANGLYEEGKYDEALALYHEMEKEGSNWKLFYNMGNCCYKLKDYVKAKIYYLRADKFNPFEPSIQKNIEIINRFFNDKIPEAKPDFLLKVALKVESIVGLNVVSILLLLSVAVLNLFIFFLLRKKRNRWVIYGVSFSLVITLLLTGYHVYRSGKAARKDTAVITVKNSELRSGPGANNTILFKVNPGLKVKIIDVSRNWVHVSASSRIAGWVEEERLERI